MQRGNGAQWRYHGGPWRGRGGLTPRSSISDDRRPETSKRGASPTVLFCAQAERQNLTSNSSVPVFFQALRRRLEPLLRIQQRQEQLLLGLAELYTA